MGRNHKFNWLTDSNNHLVKTARGYRGTIVVNVDGTATLTISYPGPSALGDAALVSKPKEFPDTNPTTYDTVKEAKQAFRVYLRDVPVTA